MARNLTGRQIDKARVKARNLRNGPRREAVYVQDYLNNKIFKETYTDLMLSEFGIGPLLTSYPIQRKRNKRLKGSEIV